ncbi:uncharacterized protein YndB with AHSA1/START domain [Herbihabitans rhizosphaerae]|uniref:Uncharacterized protein YndB with AHSA1/START domain n=1 Tax=Herbihabitans rhizosphaerae TaxID=1872711 RepID=A0A4Q7KGZ8_9PSEU|nr:SRPBCC domain-containing protein [Herbihabitans rhizosphaerae]RZS34409.1 uncharacterized protein YndB with AHSA1/START domain [Herbihabitans rhizosphaerae]
MQDKIEREVLIEAPVARVWDLVTVPGWWINDGDPSVITRQRDGDFDVVEHPKYGKYPVRLEKSEPPRYAAFRWASEFAGKEPVEGNSTLIEFTLTERDGGTVLRVVESGFASLGVAEDARAKAIEGNTDGWAQQLKVIAALAVG